MHDTPSSVCCRPLPLPEPSQPGYCGQHTQPSQNAHKSRDLGVMLQPAQAGEDMKPIVLHVVGVANCDQGELLGARIGHVGSDVEKIFEEEESAKSRSCGLPAVRTGNGPRKPYEESKEPATQVSQRLTAITEQ